MTTEGTFVDMFRNPRNGPYLPVMGVTAELEVDMLLLSLFQMVRLMDKQDAVLRAVGLLH
jgi:hypothetical protein